MAAAMMAALVGGGLALLGATPAAAGAWAVTVVDRVPDRMESARPYQVRFWVLQHGTHPYDWPDPLGDVGLALIDHDGKVIMFRGTRCPSRPTSPPP
jgi:hypothetical protein